MANKFSDIFLRNASRLDKALCQDGLLYQKAELIEAKNDASAIFCFCEQLREAGKDPRLAQLSKETYESLVYSSGFNTITVACKKSEELCSADSISIEDLLQELNNLVGLTEVKKIVNDLISYQKVQLLRTKQGLKNPKRTLHLAFTGNPGTGKTTVARIVGRIYKQLGILSKGHFTEVSRTDLIAGYQGQTALKVKGVIDRARGGVLFIDEAYSLTENDHSDSYGRECLTELTKALEDYREDLVVIVAGYTEPMKLFFESNPGLKSRFNNFIEFPDFTSDELLQILLSNCNNDNYCMPQQVLAHLNRLIVDVLEKVNGNFSNGRFVRNLYEEIIVNHARRVCSIENPTIEDLQTIDITDIPENESLMRPFSTKSNDYYAAKYVAEASLFYEQKMLQLVDGDREKLRTSVPGVPLPNHLAYKLEPLYSKDGHRMYEFLIEYHTKKPSEGIYYGCRGVTLPGYVHNEEIEQLRKEWEQVKGEVCTILNNTFPSKDFSHRFRMTDNANDQTYWLFWISLYEDEDIHDVGLRATEIIRSVFARVLNGESVESYPMPSKKLQNDVAFTNESYQQLLDKIDYSGYVSPIENHAHAEAARAWFGEFLERACSQRFLIRSNLYENAWQFLLPNTDFSRMMVALFTCMDNYNITCKEGTSRVSKVPWESVCKVFLSHDGMPFPTNIKQQYKRDGVYKNQESMDEWVEKIEEMMDLQKK